MSYESDIAEWSAEQAALLRRVASGELNQVVGDFLPAGAAPDQP
jgi:hypothetical protein